MRSSTRRAGCALSVLVLLALTGCTGGGDARIELGPVALHTVSETVEAPGSVVPAASVTLRAPSTGTVATLLVSDGEEVSEGDRLLSLDSPSALDALARAEQARAELTGEPPGPTPGPGDQQAGDPGAGEPGDDAATRAADEATRRSEEAFAAAEAALAELPPGQAREAAAAQIAAARASLNSARAGAEAALERVEAALERVEAGVAGLTAAAAALSSAQQVQAEAAVDAAQRTVDALTVRAPIDGVVSLGSGQVEGAGGFDPSSLLGAGLDPGAASNAADLLSPAGGGGAAAGPALSVGVPVQAGAVLATVTDASTLSVRAEVDETDVLAVAEGQEATIQLDAVPDVQYAGEVLSVDPAPASSPRGGVTYAVRVSLDDGETATGREGPTPRPGMSVVVALAVAEADDVASVPAAAVIRDGGRDTVWVVENGEAVRRVVDLGAQGDAFVEVTDGLQVGEQVVVGGAGEVSAGQQVS